MKKFMRKRKIGSHTDWSKEKLEEFIKLRTKHFIKKHDNKIIKPYKFKRLKENLELMFRYANSENYPKYKSIITRIINKLGSDYFEENIATTRHATTVDIKTINEIARYLIRKSWKEIITALILLWSHYTGARTGEITKLRWEDFRKTKNESGKYWIWRVRTSKTNKIAQREEQLTYVRHPSKQLFEKIYQNYRKCQGSPKQGKIFPQKFCTALNSLIVISVMESCLPLDFWPF